MPEVFEITEPPKIVRKINNKLKLLLGSKKVNPEFPKLLATENSALKKLILLIEKKIIKPKKNIPKSIKKSS